MDWLKGQKSAQALVTFRPDTASNRVLYLAVNGFMTIWHFVLDADLSNTLAPSKSSLTTTYVKSNISLTTINCEKPNVGNF